MNIYLLAIAVLASAVSGALAGPPSNHPPNQSSRKVFHLQLKDEKFDDAEKRFDETMQKALPARNFNPPGARLSKPTAGSRNWRRAASITFRIGMSSIRPASLKSRRL